MFFCALEPAKQLSICFFLTIRGWITPSPRHRTSHKNITWYFAILQPSERARSSKPTLPCTTSSVGFGLSIGFAASFILRIPNHPRHLMCQVLERVTAGIIGSVLVIPHRENGCRDTVCRRCRYGERRG